MPKNWKELELVALAFWKLALWLAGKYFLPAVKTLAREDGQKSYFAVISLWRDPGWGR